MERCDRYDKRLGQGTTAFNSIYPFYSYSGVGAEHTHNLFLQLFIETGILGFGTFIGLLFKFYQYLCSGLKISKNKDVSIKVIAFVSGI